MGIPLTEKIKNFFNRKKQAEYKPNKIEEFLEGYQEILDLADFKFKAFQWIVFGLIIATVLATLSAFVISVAFPKTTMFMAFVVFLVILDIFLGYPYILALKKIDAIEEALPSALKQMADVLKAGGTYEAALREVTAAEYGPLTKEIELVLRKTEEGESLENSLKELADSINSRIVKRSVTVITDTVKAGAGLADVLDDIADDLKAMHRIEKERITETQLQVIFMVAAGAIVAPAILGLVSSVINLFINAATSLNVSPQQVVESIIAKNAIVTLLQLYIFVEIAAVSAMIALMRHGRIGKGVTYLPILLLMAYMIYYSSAGVSELFLGGI